MQIHHEHDADLVPPEDACPQCGERRVDQLVWIDDDTVRCAGCGKCYDPLAKGGDHETTA